MKILSLFLYLVMHANEEIIHTLFRAFQELNAGIMAECYHEEAEFRDEVFSLKGKDEIGAMWAMLCGNARDFSLDYRILNSNEDEVTVKWEPVYIFSATGRKVKNEITGTFRFRESKIYRHRDRFSFPRWSRQALGFTGFVLGHTGFLKNKVRKQAAEKLAVFRKKHASPAT